MLDPSVSRPAVVEESVLQVLNTVGLSHLQNHLIFSLQVRRLEHLARINEKDLLAFGVSTELIRKLRTEIQIKERELWNQSDPKSVIVKNNQSLAAASSSSCISKDEITFNEPLGEGSFSIVKKGVWRRNDGTNVEVAVKILRDVSPIVLQDLQIEASHMLKLQHPSLTRLYGIVTAPAMLVLELCGGGSLLDRLRDDRKPVLLITQMLDYCSQISKALQFLETKHCVHRDVAARNILLTTDERMAKLSDFGLMRGLKENEQMYIMSPQKRVPFAWCPPESLRFRKFSHASDVWSFGVLMWEIFSLGEEPWFGCNAKEVLTHISNGDRLEKPTNCPERIYRLMLACWRKEAEERPKFSSIKDDLKNAAMQTLKVREETRPTDKSQLKLVRGDEVVVIENSGSVWTGQNKKTRQFGTFPREVIFVPDSVTPASIVNSPQAKTTPMTIVKPRPSTSLQPTKTSGTNEGSSRISLPIRGSFIHTGHGDGIGGHSWGDPSLIDNVYLKNPVKGSPLQRSPAGALLVDAIVERNQGTSNPRQSVQIAPLNDIWDDFENAQNESFSPSHIELPTVPDTSMLPGVTPVLPPPGSVLIPTRVTTEQNPPAKFNAPGYHAHFPPSVMSELRQLPVRNNSSTNILAPPTVLKPTTVTMPQQRSTSMVSPPTSFFESSTLDTRKTSLYPMTETAQTVNGIFRPRPHSSIGGSIVQNATKGDTQQPQQLPGGPSAVPCLIPTRTEVHLRPVKTSPIIVMNEKPQETSEPRPVPLNHRTTRHTESTFLPTMPKSKDQNENRVHGGVSWRQNDEEPIKHQTQLEQRNKLQQRHEQEHQLQQQAVQKLQQQKQQAQARQPALFQIGTTPLIANTSQEPQAKAQTTPPFVATSSKPSPPLVINNSERGAVSRQENRQSRIEAEVNMLLPPPSKLLTGSTASTSQVVLKQNVEAPRPQSVIVKTKVDEPQLSMSNVLQPIPLHSTSREAHKPAPVVPVPVAKVVKTEPIATQNHVPLFNITNSIVPVHRTYNPQYAHNGPPYYPSVGYPGYPSYGFNTAINVAPRLYPSLMSIQAPLPPLGQPNQQTSITNPLGANDSIHEFLRSAPQPTTATGGRLTSGPNLGASEMSSKMEWLYKQADFTERSKCDSEVNDCGGDVVAALKVLKQKHLRELGLVSDLYQARSVLEQKNYDLAEAANYLLG